jgi:hypothetical protein
MNEKLLQYLKSLGLTDQEISDISTEDNINWANEYLDAFGTSEQVLKNTARSLINAKRNKRQQEWANRSAQAHKDYWHPIKGSWERFKTDWNLGRHPIQGGLRTFGVAILGASIPAAVKALIFNPLGSALGYAGGAAGSKIGEHVDKKLGVDNMFSVAGGIIGGIKPYKYGTNATKRALEIAMRTSGGLNRYK